MKLKMTPISVPIAIDLLIVIARNIDRERAKKATQKLATRIGLNILTLPAACVPQKDLRNLQASGYFDQF
jgi:hypothetical protein